MNVLKLFPVVTGQISYTAEYKRLIKPALKSIQPWNPRYREWTHRIKEESSDLICDHKFFYVNYKYKYIEYCFWNIRTVEGVRTVEGMGIRTVEGVTPIKAFTQTPEGQTQVRKPGRINMYV